MKQERGHFATNIGIILATAGSAVGLGNIWRFPYLVGEDGGAAFILVYLVCVILLGIPGMVAEFIVGRHGAANAVRAYGIVGGKKGWRGIGLLGVITSTIILGFYAVVAGWCLQYFFASLANQIHGGSSGAALYFKQFSSSAIAPAALAVVFILITHLVVTKGVRHGIERVSKLLMPLLFILLIVIVIASCSLNGSMEGIRFLFHPDVSKITTDVVLDALGQAFFSLSLGTACLCTYASYFGRQTNLMKSASQIALIDTLIAILAGLMIFPAAFSVGVKPDAGPSLIFITLPNVFEVAFANVPVVGYIISVLFYGLLVLAALTSTISMHEIGTAHHAAARRMADDGPLLRHRHPLLAVARRSRHQRAGHELPRLLRHADQQLPVAHWLARHLHHGGMDGAAQTRERRIHQLGNDSGSVLPLLAVSRQVCLSHRHCRHLLASVEVDITCLRTTKNLSLC